MSNELAVAIVGVMVILAQAVPITWMIYRDKKRDRDPKVVIKNTPTPGKEEICLNHHRELGQLAQAVETITKLRREDLDDQKTFRADVKITVGKIFDSINSIRRGGD